MTSSDCFIFDLSPPGIEDVCMVNNGSGPGQTKAYVFLSSVYNVMKAVRALNGSHFFGQRPVKVVVPYENRLMQRILDNQLKV